MNIEVPEIAASRSTSYNNNLYLSFHTSIYEKIKSITFFDAESEWSSFRDAYGVYVDDYTEKNKISRVNIETPEMKDIDAERGRIGSLLYYIVSNGLNSKNAAVLKAAQEVDAAIRPYKGFQNEAYLSETIMIKGLLVDIRKEGLKESVAKLGLTTLLDDLEATNNKFDELSKQRTDKQSVISRQISIKEMRNQMDKTYNTLCHLIFSIAFLADPKSGDYEIAVQLINDFNGIIKRHKTTHNMSMGQKNKKLEFKPVEGEEETDTEIPENS